MFRPSATVSALAIMAAVAVTPAAANQRAFVASTGSDGNTASSCGLTAPCRTFAAAMTIVDDGGEIVALDAAGYGPVTVTKSVTVTSNPGFYAGISAATGNAVTIAMSGVNVTLRGLSINGIGSANGVVMTNGVRLSIENCVISNFSENGVDVQTPATVRIVDSLIRDNGNGGVYLHSGATATISGTKVLGNDTVGVYVDGSFSNRVTTAAIADSNVSANYIGVYVNSSAANATARASVTRSTLSNNEYGLITGDGAGTAVLTLSDSLVTGNTANGLWQDGGSTLESLGNNTVRQNGANLGRITSVSPM
jgi:hypothetical protein